ncbi:hypothetical protein J7643_16000 [bacterium]|nr:hypothetical protein [bacterium]
MRTCYQHAKIEAVAHCRRCKLPVCFHCVEDQYCPDCVKMQRYLHLGRTGARKPQLVETPTVRSKTMELMIQRLQAQAFDADAASLPDSKPVRRASAKRPIKTRTPLRYGMLLPGVSPFIKVTRSPLSRLAMVAVTAFGLGAFFAHPRTTYAEPAPVVAETVSTEAALQPEPEVRVHYKPVYIYLDEKAPAAAPAPIAAPIRTSQNRLHYAPAIASIQ